MTCWAGSGSGSGAADQSGHAEQIYLSDPLVVRVTRLCDPLVARATRLCDPSFFGKENSKAGTVSGAILSNKIVDQKGETKSLTLCPKIILFIHHSDKG
jgi:hypothetical protein